MKLSRLFNLIVKYGVQSDPRSHKSSITSYADSALLYGDGSTDVKKVMVGIDIEVPEILLADRLRSQGKRIDLIIAHHPEGSAFAALSGVMCLQTHILVKAGVPERLASKLLEDRIEEVSRRLLPANHMRAVDAARLLDIPFICAHTPADNHAAEFIQGYLKKKKPKRLEDIVTALEALPEYRLAKQIGCGPKIILGSPRRNVGNIFLEMTGGTEGPKDVYETLYKKGIRTLVSMHLGDEHFKKVKDADLNVVVAGHISSDTLGLNLLLDKVEKEERLSIIECSGFTRFRRS
jgi:putative NIF3 family GTP cyclohydrolase 1 type 2